MVPVDLLLDAGAVYRKISPSEIIFREGTTPTSYYQLVSGRVKICNLIDDGREILHNLVEPGECFGVIPFFDKGLYAASAIADSPCMLLRIGISSFEQILRDHPTVHFSFSQSLASDLRFKMMLASFLSQNNPENILVSLIHYLNQEGKLICQDCKRLMLTRQQLANMTGLRVETIIRTIKNLEREERLSIVRGKVFVPSDGMG